MWNWLQGLQGGAPAFVGSAVGSAFGIFSLLVGALFNAYLNRRRDDRLRQKEQAGVLAAILAEIENVIETLSRNADSLSNPRRDFFRIPDISQSCRILPKAIDKLYLLPRPAITAAINAHTIIEQYSDHMFFIGGTPINDVPKNRLLFYFELKHAAAVKAVNEGSIDILNKYLFTISSFKII